MQTIVVSVLLCVAVVACVGNSSPVLPQLLGHSLYLQHAKRAPHEDECYKQACEGGNGACGISNSTEILCLGEQTYCKLAPNGVMGTCAKTQDNGASCETDEECMSGYCSPRNMCEPDDYNNKGNGESCTSARQCASLRCGNVCEAIPTGYKCVDDDQCAPEDYCPSGTPRVCTKRDNIGQKCNRWSCAGLMECSAGGMCVVPFTTPSGRACIGNECAEGTACAPSFNGTDICTVIPASSDTACSSDSDCTRMGEDCECNNLRGTQVCTQNYFNTPKGLASAAYELNNCLINKCKGPTTNVDICMEGVCKQQTCYYQKVYADGVYEMYSDMFPKCVVDYMMKQAVCQSARTMSSSARVLVA